MDDSGRLFSPAFILLSLADLAYFTATGLAIFALPLFVTGPIGSNKAGAGVAFGAFAITALILRPFAGRASDSWGRRPLLAGGAALCAIGLLLHAFSSSLWAVIALRLLLGCAEAAFFVAGFAALADLAPPSRMGEALSYNSLGLYLGLSMGPPLGELLLERWNFTVTWVGGAVLALIATAIALAMPETRKKTSQPTAPAKLIHRQAIAPSIGFFASLTAIGGFLAFASLHAQGIALTNTSLALLLYGLVVVIGRIAFAKVPDRLPSLPLGAAALAVTAAGLGLAAALRTPTGFLCGTVLIALGVTFSTPAFFSAVFATALPSERGSAAGTASIFLDLGLGGGPILLGLVAQAAGIPAAFAVAAAVALAGSLWTIWLAFRRAPSHGFVRPNE